MAGVITGQQIYADVNYGGAYQIAGTVTDGALPSSYRTRLFDQVSGALVRESWSINGAYEFTRIANRPNGYYVVCHNHMTKKAAIFSDQLPSAM